MVGRLWVIFQKQKIFLSVVKSFDYLVYDSSSRVFSIIIIVSIKKANEISMPIKKLTESTKLVQRGQYDVQMDNTEYIGRNCWTVSEFQ